MRPLSLRARRLAWGLGAPAVLALLVAVSLEEVTDDPPPLDPRFVQGGGESGVGPGPGLVPFADYEGETVTVRGTLVSDDSSAADLDLWQIDPDAPGSRAHLGKVPVTGPGPFELEVPVGFGTLQIESFQDKAGDGPTDDDPFGRVDCQVADADVDGVELVLEAGALGRMHTGPPGGEGGEGGGGPVHVEMPPGGHDASPEPNPGEGAHNEAEAGAPGGDQHQHVEAAPGAPGGGGDHVHIPDAQPAGGPPGAGTDPFASSEGPRVTLSGTLLYADAGAVLDFDIFRNDPSGPGGRAFVGKKKVQPGPFSFEVPQSFGTVSIEVFLDATSDGPSADDPFAVCPCNPVDLSKGDVDGIQIRVESGR